MGKCMTANELADLLEVDSWYKLITREKIATMLRQQQAEIEALKAENKQLTEWLTKVGFVK
jgi:cell shape-determining protein MreC